MNLIKSFFIAVAPVWLIFVCYYGINRLLLSGNELFNLGILFSSLPLLVFLSYIMLIRNVVRTSKHLLPVLVPSSIGYCLTLFVFLKNPNIDYLNGLIFSMSAFLLTFLYIYWYSNNSRTHSKLLKSQNKIPLFSLLTTNNENIDSSVFMGNKFLLFFYRGNWCPLCMAQIDEVVKEYKRFEQKEIQLAFISPQPETNSEKLAKKHGLSFKFYTDKNNMAAKKLGILHKFGLPMGFQSLGYESDTVYPTVIAINKQGEIIYSNQTSNYRVRPNLDELLNCFDE